MDRAQQDYFSSLLAKLRVAYEVVYVKLPSPAVRMQ